jgi:hypothetical protein
MFETSPAKQENFLPASGSDFQGICKDKCLGRLAVLLLQSEDRKAGVLEGAVASMNLFSVYVGSLNSIIKKENLCSLVSGWSELGPTQAERSKGSPYGTTAVDMV